MEKGKILTILISIITIIKSHIILSLGSLFYVFGAVMFQDASGAADFLQRYNEALKFLLLVILLPYLLYFIAGITLFFKKKWARKAIIILAILELIIYTYNIWSFQSASIIIISFIIIDIFILTILLNKKIKEIFCNNRNPK